MLKIIDSISDWQGRAFSKWLAIFLVLVVVYDVFMRYAFRAPTMWGHETAFLIGGTLYVMGWSYCHRHRGHIRVDLIYNRFSPRGKAIIDTFGHIFLFFPLMYCLISTAWFYTWRSWEMNEKSIETYWYPPLAPFRTVVLIGLFLYTLQGIAHLIRDLHYAIRNKAYD